MPEKEIKAYTNFGMVIMVDRLHTWNVPTIEKTLPTSLAWTFFVIIDLKRDVDV